MEACRARGVTFRYNASLEGLRPLVVEQQPLPQQQQHNHEHQEALPEAEQQQQGQQQEQLQTPLQAAAEAGQGEAGAGAGGEAGARQRRKGKGRGKGRGRRESSGSDSEAEEEERRRRAVRWVCQLQDGTEHVTDKVVGGEPWGGRASMCSRRRSPLRSHSLQQHATLQCCNDEIVPGAAGRRRRDRLHIGLSNLTLSCTSSSDFRWCSALSHRPHHS